MNNEDQTKKQLTVKSTNQIRLKNFELYRESAIRNIENAIETYSFARNGLFSLSFLLLPLSVTFVSDDKVILNDSQKVITVMILIFLLISLIPGAIQIFIDYNFYKKAAKNDRLMQREWVRSDKTLEEIKESSRRIEESLPEQTTLTPLILQATFSAIALVLIVILSITIIFK